MSSEEEEEEVVAEGLGLGLADLDWVVVRVEGIVVGAVGVVVVVVWCCFVLVDDEGEGEVLGRAELEGTIEVAEMVDGVTVDTVGASISVEEGVEVSTGVCVLAPTAVDVEAVGMTGSVVVALDATQAVVLFLTFRICPLFPSPFPLFFIP